MEMLSITKRCTNRQSDTQTNRSAQVDEDGKIDTGGDQESASSDSEKF